MSLNDVGGEPAGEAFQFVVLAWNTGLVYTTTSTTTSTSSQSSTCPYKEPTVSIKSGSTGEGAKWVQWYLNKKSSAGLTVDGIFGAKSVAALKKFQTSAGLTADGVCGAATRTALKK
jgi:peptidoglycan hydrolase-like protein with peptidoglycan-binding domain